MPRLLVASVLLCAVACGGDAKPGASPSPSPSTTSVSPTPSAMTKEAYVAAVNTICTRVQTEGDAVPEPKTAKEYLTALTTLIGILDKAQAELRLLAPPATDVAALETNFLGPNDQQAAALKAVLPSVTSAASSNDLAAAEAAFGQGIQEFSTVGEAHAKWQSDYGFSACSG